MGKKMENDGVCVPIQYNGSLLYADHNKVLQPIFSRKYVTFRATKVSRALDLFPRGRREGRVSVFMLLKMRNARA